MNKHLFLRSLGALLVAGMGTIASAQDDEENNGKGERRVRIEITRNENGQKSHVTREFDLNDQQQLQDALRELGVMDEMNVIGDGENLVIDMKRMRDGGMLNDMSMALSLPDELEAPEEPQAFLGVYYADQVKGDHTSAAKEGARITGVDEDTPAAKAGLKEGDVIVELGGKKVADGESLVEAINGHQPGDNVKVIYYRGKQKSTVDVTLGERASEERNFNFNWNDDSEAPSSQDMDWDAYNGAGNWNPEEHAFLGVVGGSSEDEKPGVRIGEVVDSTAARRMGLKEGDIIRSINGNPVEDFGELSEEIGDMKPGDTVKIDLTRDDKDLALEGKLGRTQSRSWRWSGSGTPPMPPAPGMPPMPDLNGTEMSPEDLAEYNQAMQEYLRDLAERARDMDEYARDRDERRREMAELREEMNHLRRDLRGDVTKEIRVTINEIKLSKEEAELLKNKGVANLDQPLELQDLRCFPNPSEGSFHIQFQVPDRGDLNVDIHDATGERVYHETISGFKGNYDRTLDMSDRAGGNYFLVITQNGKAQARKLEKQ